MLEAIPASIDGCVFADDITIWSNRQRPFPSYSKCPGGSGFKTKQKILCMDKQIKSEYLFIQNRMQFFQQGFYTTTKARRKHSSHLI